MLKFNEPHLCPDWDFMLLVPGSPEMDCCTCGDNGHRIPAGTKVKTGFYRHEANKVREVEKCFIAPVKSQSGFYIQTTDGLSCDAGWFEVELGE